MEERINSLYENPMELTRAEEAWFYQMDLKERERIGKEEGIAIGKEEGKLIGIDIGKIKAYTACIEVCMVKNHVSFDEAADMLSIPRTLRSACLEKLSKSLTLATKIMHGSFSKQG